MYHIPTHHRLHILLILIGLLTGLLAVMQFRSFKEAETLARDTNANNIFREVQVLKITNDQLEKEIEDLGLQLENVSDAKSYRESVTAELEKNRLIAGLTKAEGQGLIVTLDVPLAVSWLVDVTNELWTAGAEAIAINGMRITPYTVGFEDFNGQTYLNKVPVRAPYKIEVIGDRDLFSKILTGQGSISARLNDA